MKVKLGRKKEGGRKDTVEDRKEEKKKVSMLTATGVSLLNGNN